MVWCTTTVLSSFLAEVLQSPSRGLLHAREGSYARLQTPLSSFALFGRKIIALRILRQSKNKCPPALGTFALHGQYLSLASTDARHSPTNPIFYFRGHRIGDHSADQVEVCRLAAPHTGANAISASQSKLNHLFRRILRGLDMYRMNLKDESSGLREWATRVLERAKVCNKLPK